MGAGSSLRSGSGDVCNWDVVAGATDEWMGGEEGDEEGEVEVEEEEEGEEEMKNTDYTNLHKFLIAGITFALIGVIFATIGISTVAAQPAPAGEEAGVPWDYIAIGAVILLLVALWIPRKQTASGGGEGGEGAEAWWATKKGREMIITLLLLFLIMAGLQYVGMKALVAGGFLFVAWMVYRYYFAGDEEGKVVTTQKLADEIAEEMEYRGVKLDSHRDVYGQFLPSLRLHLIQFSHPTTLVYIINVKTGERGGPLCSTLNEVIEKIYAKRELWMPPAGKGEKKGLEPQISQIGAEEGGAE